MKTAAAGILSAALLTMGSVVFADSVTFLDSDSQPAFSLDTTSGQVTFSAAAEAASEKFEHLSENGALPSDLQFLVREAAVRYAALELAAPAVWTARDVREVFRTPEDIVSFMDRHFNVSTQR